MFNRLFTIFCVSHFLRAMAGNDIYNDRSGITCTPTRMTSEKARTFMKEVSKHPTHLTKEWVVRDVRRGSRLYYNV